MRQNVFALAVVLMLAFALLACGKKDEPTKTSDSYLVGKTFVHHAVISSESELLKEIITHSISFTREQVTLRRIKRAGVAAPQELSVHVYWYTYVPPTVTLGKLVSGSLLDKPSEIPTEESIDRTMTVDEAKGTILHEGRIHTLVGPTIDR